MQRREQGSSASSLPSSLIPLMFKPQEHRDNVSNPSNTERQVPPVSPLTRGMGRLSTDRSPQPSSSTVPVSPTAFAYTGNRSSPRFFPQYSRVDQISNPNSFVGSGDPQISGVRQTLGPNIHAIGQRYSNSIYGDPAYRTPRPPASFRTEQGYSLPPPTLREQFLRQEWSNWREEEPEQASLTFSRSSSTAHPLARFNQQTDSFNGPTWPEEQPDGFSSNALTEPEIPRRSLRAGVIPSHTLYEARSVHNSPTIQELPPPPALFPGSGVSSSAIYSSRHEASQDLTPSPISQRTWPSEETAGSTSLIPPLTPAKRGRDSSEPSSIGTEKNGHGSNSARREKKRHDSVNTRKDERPRKTAVACNFCRGRKLKCDGERPTCGVCYKRSLGCEYVENPKRRGPGKANKGSRRKRGEREIPTSAKGRIASPPIMEQRRGNVADGVQAYTPVISLENFTIQPPGSRPGEESEPQRQRGHI